MISATILIALAVNGLMINPVYTWLLNRLKLNNTKPYSCILCLSTWSAVGVLICTQNINLVFLPLTASFTAVAISRWFESLPVRMK
jgi:hypothetical protein